MARADRARQALRRGDPRSSAVGAVRDTAACCTPAVGVTGGSSSIVTRGSGRFEDGAPSDRAAGCATSVHRPSRRRPPCRRYDLTRGRRRHRWDRVAVDHDACNHAVRAGDDRHVLGQFDVDGDRRSLANELRRSPTRPVPNRCAASLLDLAEQCGADLLRCAAGRRRADDPVATEPSCAPPAVPFLAHSEVGRRRTDEDVAPALHAAEVRAAPVLGVVPPRPGARRP